MINKLHIKNYKILKDNQFELSNLNIFTGLNGMGKSSLIQTLLLLRQSYLQNNFLEKEGLLLKHEDNYVDIGRAKDAFSIDAETSENIFFGIDWENDLNASFYFDYIRESDTSSEQDKVKERGALRKSSLTTFPDDIFW